MERYTLNQLALITGLTTRTLRNHLASGLLGGEKIDGNWAFTEEDIGKFLAAPEVKQALAAKDSALVHDFMADAYKKTNSICMMLDFPVGHDEASAISDFFCRAVSESEGGVQMRFNYDRGCARVILSGREEPVLTVIRAYYSR